VSAQSERLQPSQGSQRSAAPSWPGTRNHLACEFASEPIMWEKMSCMPAHVFLCAATRLHLTCYHKYMLTIPTLPLIWALFLLALPTSDLSRIYSSQLSTTKQHGTEKDEGSLALGEYLWKWRAGSHVSRCLCQGFTFRRLELYGRYRSRSQSN
jgi:hypothetical protein